MNNDAKIILSLDGGGIKGISVIMILHEIMTRVNKLREDRHH